VLSDVSLNGETVGPIINVEVDPLTMVIRRAQFDALTTSSDHNFARRIAGFVRSHLPSESQPFSEERLFHETERQIARAREAGLKSEADVASFVAFRFMAGSNFRSEPRFEAIWARSDLDGSAKVAKTRELLSSADERKRA
jgi:hypothetical protein